MLEPLGHCLSYDEINYVETLFANRQAIQERHRSYLPNLVQPSTFITFVYDNCDHNPETLSGTSMHFTNGIIIQRAVGNATEPNRETNLDASYFERKKRSFQPIQNEIQPYYATKERINPDTVQEIEEQRDFMVEHISQRQDTLWSLCRYKASEELHKQIIPSWSGFNFEVSPISECRPHDVYFLPPINKSPTKFDTVQEMLLQVKETSKRLQLPHADLVLDHAIYAKALEVLSNPNLQECRDMINLRMEGFHACAIFIAVIGKRFSSAGLKDVIIESDLLGISSVESTLNGK